MRWWCIVLLGVAVVLGQPHTTFEERWSCNPQDYKTYDTDRLRAQFLVSHEALMTPDQVGMVYTHNDRMIVGGAIPTTTNLTLSPVDPMRASFFLERREVVIYNVGPSTGVVEVSGTKYSLAHQDAIYVGLGEKSVQFHNPTGKGPGPRFYFVSTLAYVRHSTKVVRRSQLNCTTIGSAEGASLRDLCKYCTGDPSVCLSSQVATGMTILHNGSVWNTFPPHTHARRTEAYFYFDMPGDQRIAHMLGTPKETRPLWMFNEEAVIATPGFVHFGAGSTRYAFVWAMAGENPFDFNDMDHIDFKDLD